MFTVVRNRRFQIIELLTSKKTFLVQHLETFLRLVQLPDLQVKLTEVFVGASMSRVYLQRLLVAFQRTIILLQLALTVSQQIQ